MPRPETDPAKRQVQWLGNKLMRRIGWLPPRDSNPDMLIQSQLSYH